ncbi:MAG TPA: HEAT repeat domain-containing protein [Myxococcaceae bacterium]|nr:HEAT repeat domain-containing protein [Myxococcaceae bacterium]
MWPLFLAAALAATPSGTVSRCAQGCQSLKDPSLRARACAGCVTASDRAAWVRQLDRLSAQGVDPAGVDRALDEAFAQPDWQVRSAVLSVRAARRGVSDLTELAGYLAAHPGPGAALAVHCAGARGESADRLAAALEGLGPIGRRARAALQAHAEEARAALELEVYDADPGVQKEALIHLAAYEDASPAAVVLTAMRTRPVAGDAFAVQALESASSEGATPLGRAIALAASPSNQEQVNRLLAVCSRRLDRARPRLSSADVQERLAAVAEVGRLAPFSAPELLQRVRDPDPRIRRGSARWLALGEGLTVSALAEKRLRAEEPPGLDAWMKVLAESGEKGCGPTATRLADDAALSPVLRASALEALGQCEGTRAWPRIQRGLTDASPHLRSGAVAALKWLPLHPAARGAVETALSDPDPEVAAAAARSAGIPGQQRLIPALSRMLAHPSPLVRSAAAEGLGAIGVADAAMAMAARLRQEPDPTVRRALVHALGALGSPAARACLQECAAADTDPQIRAEAEHALRTAPP